MAATTASWIVDIGRPCFQAFSAAVAITAWRSRTSILLQHLANLSTDAFISFPQTLAGL
ncbi:hypothetical protein EV129_104113 [Rhizobium azibense]|uniref:Uncharacterized protein n=1 Tax=Rhizobium azibense TaxID=1136135 RepID=A0A4R3RUR7_9HYPH|nr:hypothetical protein EV129_104113 [Rhizobium azibense]